MKKLILITLLAFLYINARPQNAEPNRRDYSPYGLDEPHLTFQMSQLATHGDATQITYFDLNFVDGLMQDFIPKHMGMAITNVSKFTKVGEYESFIVTHTQMATMGGKPAHLYFKYLIFTNKQGHPIIKSLEIYGNSDAVINFFVSYWPTTTNFNSRNSKIAYNYLLQDKATIQFDRSTAAWSINVENTTIHSLQGYYEELNKQRSGNVNTSSQQAKISIEPIDPQLLVTLKRGLNYNDSNLELWMLTIANKKLSVGNTFFNGKFIIRIDTTGIVYKISPYNLTTTMPKPIIDSIKAYLIGKKMSPYSYQGVSFPSYKNYSITFMPPMDRKIRIMDNGTLDGNPNITLTPVQ